MDIKELKTAIENKNISDNFLILKYSDSLFLCEQYINAIAKIKGLEKLKVENLSEINDPEDDLFDNSANYLYVYYTDKLLEYKNIKNLIIVCKEVDKDLVVDYVEIPKVLDWQIEDFIQMRLEGLSAYETKWLADICNHDIYRLDEECKKLEIFDPPAQKVMFDLMNKDNAYSDLTNLTIFNFTNALLKKDFKTLGTILSDLITIDVEGSAIPTIMIRQLKNLIDIQLNPRATAESLGMKSNQFYAIKHNVGTFSDKQLINMFEFITSIDMGLKNGDLTLKDGVNHLTVNNMLVDYITINLMNIATQY